MNHAVVTGASSGIGRATTYELARHGWHVFASVRSEHAATDISDALGRGVTPVLMDVAESNSVQSSSGVIDRELGDQSLRAIVNCAGIGGSGPLAYQPLDEVRAIFEVNVFGVLRVIQALLPRMSRSGRIVNVSSVGGRIAFPFLGAYAGSKHALEAISDSLRRELGVFGVDVIVVEPASVRTAVWDKAEQSDSTRYAGTPYAAALARLQPMFIRRGRRGMPPESVAQVIRRALEDPRPSARYALPGDQRAAWDIGRRLPDRWFDWLIASQTRLPRG